MRVTAMVLGIIWGLFLMFYALYVFFAGELTSAVGMGDKSLSMLGSVLTPILVFVGAGLAMRKPVIAAALFLFAGIMVFATLGLNGASAFFGGPVLIAAALAFFGAKELSDLTTQPTTQGN